MSYAALAHKAESAEATKRSSCLRVGEPNDAFEQEADRVADRVMTGSGARWSIARMNAGPSVQRKCSCGGQGECEECKKKKLQRKAASSAPSHATPNTDRVLQSAGRPLDRATRAFMEPRFGHDFSQVRIHADGEAAQSASELHAKAYTVGNHIAFASGSFAPSTREGGTLLAHELTHVVQQNGAMAAVQRAPAFEGCTLCSKPLSDSKLRSEPSNPFAGSSDQGIPMVSVQTLITYAAQEAWNNAEQSGQLKRIFSPLQRRDPLLNTYWSRYLSGPWADQVPDHRIEVIDQLNRRATDLLVKEIKATLVSGHIPPGAQLETDPARITKIEQHPSADPVPTGGGWGSTATIGYTWGGRQVVSTLIGGGVVFELVDHPGIYFELSGTYFFQQAYMQKMAEDISEGTKGLAAVGRFIKGFLTALASPLLIAAETGARVIDMATLFQAAGIKFLTGHEIGYTCFSSTCRNYEACVDEKKKTGDEDDCKSETLKAALKEATIVLPLYEQGQACVDGDLEACGGIAALSVGLFEEGAGRLSKNELKVPGAVSAKRGRALTPEEFEDAAIREKIGRPREGAPHFEQSLEKPEAPEAAPAGKPKAASPDPKMTKIRKEQFQQFGAHIKIDPKLIETEVTALETAANDPANVHIPADADYDAEMTVSAKKGEEHHFRREKKGTKRWCRFSPPPGECGVPTSGEFDRKVNEALRKKGGVEHEPPAPSAPALTKEDRLKVIEERAKAPAPKGDPGPQARIQELHDRYGKELRDNPEIRAQLDYAERLAAGDPARSAQEIRAVRAELDRIRKGEGSGSSKQRVHPYERDLAKIDKRLGRGAAIAKEQAALAKGIENKIAERGAKGVKVEVVATERTEAGAGQGRAAAREGVATAPAIEYAVDLPDNLRKSAGLPKRSPGSRAGIFKPDDIRFEGDGYRFFDHKEVSGAWEDSYYSSDHGAGRIRKMLQRDLRIAEAMPGCKGWIYSTNIEGLATMLAAEITKMGGGKLLGVTMK